MANVTLKNGESFEEATVRKKEENYVRFVDSDGYTRIIPWTGIEDIEESAWEAVPAEDKEAVDSAVKMHRDSESVVESLLSSSRKGLISPLTEDEIKQIVEERRG